MLESLLGHGGLLLLRDSVEWEGRSLLKALVRETALSGEQVHVLGLEVSEEEFREGLDPEVNSRLVYHDHFRDPLNWSDTAEAPTGGPLGALRTMCTRPKPVTIVVDSLSWLLLHFTCSTLCQSLHSLTCQSPCHVTFGFDKTQEETKIFHLLVHSLNAEKQPVQCWTGLKPGYRSPAEHVRVLGLLHEELHGPGPVGALSNLAQTEVTLGGTLGQASAHILYRRPRQRPTQQTQWFSILPDFSLALQERPPLEPQPHPVPHTSPVDHTTHLTFNLRLSKKEKEAKDSLTLPFQFSSEKQQALLRPRQGQATSHIFYEPDVYDDLDQEDPDDDLDV